MTNYEYILKLPPEEMAKELTEVDWCDSSCELRKGYDCKDCLTNWLKSEREE